MRSKIFMIEPAGTQGVSHYTYALCNSLGELGYAVTLVTAKKYELESLDRKFAIRHTFNRYRTNPLALVRLALMLGREKTSVIHLQGGAHPELYVPFLALCKLLCGSKVIYTSHDVLPRKRKLYHGFASDLLFHLCDKIVVHAQANKEELQITFKVLPSKVTVVPHGNEHIFKMVRQSHDPPAYLPGDAKERTILFFGNILEYKGLDVLIKSLPAVRARIPGVRLLIVGKPYEDICKYLRLIEELSLKSAVELDLRYIPMDEVARYFKSADVVAVPYKQTYQSGIVHLAYTFARPIVATATGGLPEVVENGRSGYLVPPGDVAGLAEALIRILEDKELAKRMGEYGADLESTKYSWQEIAKSTLRVYGLERSPVQLTAGSQAGGGKEGTVG